MKVVGLILIILGTILVLRSPYGCLAGTGLGGLLLGLGLIVLEFT